MQLLFSKALSFLIAREQIRWRREDLNSCVRFRGGGEIF